MKDKTIILDKCEAMTLLCTKASSHWSFIKFCFNIPMVITSSAMCIINSISTDANTVKIPNIVVNALSVLIISFMNSIKPSEKFDLFKKLSNNFMELSQEIDSVEGNELSKDQYEIILLKYENLIKECAFEEIPQKIKIIVAELYYNNSRHIPIQLNGTTGNMKKRNSKSIEISSEIV